MRPRAPPILRCRPRCGISPSASCRSIRRTIRSLPGEPCGAADGWPATRLRPRATRRSLRERSTSEPATRRDRSRRRLRHLHAARAIEATEHVPFASAYDAGVSRRRWKALDDLDAYELEGCVHCRPSSRCASPAARARSSSAEEAPSRSAKRSISCGTGSRSRPIGSFGAWHDCCSRQETRGATSSRRRRDSRCGRMPTVRVAARWFGRAPPRGGAGCRRCSSSRSIESSRDRARGCGPRLCERAGVGAHRGRCRSFGRARRFESDGDDARAVIDWIAQQPWSDGRVAHAGHGYGGFVAWSAAKRLPAALKAIATSDPMAPGIDCRWRTESFRTPPIAGLTRCWLRPTTSWRTTRLAGAASSEDWFRSGRSYRDFPTLPGRAQRRFPQLVESSELRSVLAEMAAVRRRVRAHRHTGAHCHRAITRPEKRPRCITSLSTISTMQTRITRC